MSFKNLTGSYQVVDVSMAQKLMKTSVYEEFHFVTKIASRWEDNIKMDLQEVGGDGDWMELAQDRKYLN